ncbi:hypothetical protein TNCV_1987631 [Trichonephila clavipes]|nr:hypothetical protein TNCV_1987631 [Trichonephila clavipes]
MPPNTPRVHKNLHAEIVEVEIGGVAIYRPFGKFRRAKSYVTCMVLKVNDRRPLAPCHDEFRGPRSDYVRQVALETTTYNLFLYSRSRRETFFT